MDELEMYEHSTDGEEEEEEDDNDDESDEELQKPVPPEELRKLEEEWRMVNAKHGNPYQPNVESGPYTAHTSQYSLWYSHSPVPKIMKLLTIV